MTPPKDGHISLVLPWSEIWHADDKGPSGRGLCRWAHEDDDRPRAPWTVVIDRPNGKDQSAHAMCDEHVTRAIELYGEPDTWRKT